MRRWLPAFLLVLACATAPAPPVARAGDTGIQRCVGADGSALYTDKACSSLGASAAPIPAELATRIVREQAHEQSLLRTSMLEQSARTVDAATPIGVQPADALVAGRAPAIGRRSVAGGCARTPTQLQMDLRGAFALGDVNRIAESYHWVGVSPRSAAQIMDRLERLAREPVADMHYFDASIGSGAQFASADASVSAAASAGGVLQILSGGGGSAHLTDFDVERYKGCYFVRF